MTVLVKAVRSDDGHQLNVRGQVMVVACGHPTTPAGVRLIVDTGASRTHLRRQALAGVAFRPDRTVQGIGGGRAPAMEMGAHLLFDGQMVTARVLVIDDPDRREDGLLGLDLMQAMEMRDGAATLRLGSRFQSPVDERLEAERCGCWPVLRGLVREHYPTPDLGVTAAEKAELEGAV